MSTATTFVSSTPVPAEGRQLASLIPGARYVEMVGAGHAVPIHDPAIINVLLREHVGD